MNIISVNIISVNIITINKEITLIDLNENKVSRET